MKRFEMQLSDEQYEKLEKMTREQGFASKSEYVRFSLFLRRDCKDK